MDAFIEISKKLEEELESIPKKWDGKEAILYMRSEGCRNWKQMEWVGFYFQFLCEQKLSGIIQIPGPEYGNVKFDGFYKIPWDFKTHVMNSKIHKIIVNDSEAICSAITEYGGVGLIIAEGEGTYNDKDRTFQMWHELLKGGKSKYEEDRIERRAPSRLRKVAFELKRLSFIKMDEAILSKCGLFQKNFRNADGSPRRPKVLLDLNKISPETNYSKAF